MISNKERDETESEPVGREHDIFQYQYYHSLRNNYILCYTLNCIVMTDLLFIFFQ